MWRSFLNKIYLIFYYSFKFFKKRKEKKNIIWDNGNDF